MSDRLLSGAFIFVTGLFLFAGAAAFLAISFMERAGPVSLLYAAGLVAAAALATSAALWMWYGSIRLGTITRAFLDLWLMAQVVLVVMRFLGEPVGFAPLVGLLWFAWWRSRLSRWLRRSRLRAAGKQMHPRTDHDIP